MSNNTTKPKILIPTKTEDQQLLAAALADTDAQPLSEEKLSQMCHLSKNKDFMRNDSYSVIFQNTGLYQIDFINDGRDLRLNFTNTYDGAVYGSVICRGLLKFTLETNGQVDLNPHGELFPLFVPELIVRKSANYVEVKIDASVKLTIASLDIDITPFKTGSL